MRVLKRIYFDGIACGNGAGGPLDQAKPVCYVEPRSNVLVNRELSLIELIYDEYNPLCVCFFSSLIKLFFGGPLIFYIRMF